jgi:ornithine cyclodeaminase/alanine dehydrogenase-like protein (mu-crystallin family)
MAARHISFEDADDRLDWLALADALEQGHDLPKAQMQDVVMQRGDDTMLSRHAWIDGLGVLVKVGQVFPQNPGKFGIPTINGIVTLFDDVTGVLAATIDFHLVTKWKTAGDSLLAARHLARPDSRNILIVGAGPVARSMIGAYSALFPVARFTLWNRTTSKAAEVALDYPDHDITVATDLPDAVAKADIISCATMANSPILRGEWLRPGQHIDLIGAYLPDMREADDATMRRARIFVDSYDTTVDQIGELLAPMESGAIMRTDILADFYSLKSGNFRRHSDNEITLHKNGGGAHLDLMTSSHILRTLT